MSRMARSGMVWSWRASPKISLQLPGLRSWCVGTRPGRLRRGGGRGTPQWRSIWPRGVGGRIARGWSGGQWARFRPPIPCCRPGCPLWPRGLLARCRGRQCARGPRQRGWGSCGRRGR
eukprot:336563-Rhodomonas_salina.1